MAPNPTQSLLWNNMNTEATQQVPPRPNINDMTPEELGWMLIGVFLLAAILAWVMLPRDPNWTGPK